MKFVNSLLLLVLFSMGSSAQEKPEKQLVYTLTLDSTLKPDFYQVNISVSEYIQYERLSKKETRASVVPLDTLVQKLLNHLSEMRFTQKIEKSSISEIDNPDNYYQSRSSQKLFQITYNFRVANKDSIDYLFKNLDRKIISGMRIDPEVYDETVEQARQLLVGKGMKLVDLYANQIAERMNQKITKSKYSILFYDGGNNSNFYDGSKKFLIDYKDINYRLSISYTYSLEDR